MPCKCQGCGNLYYIDIGVPDKVWEQIKPKGKPKGAGLLCGVCIITKLEAKKKHDAFELKEIPI